MTLLVGRVESVNPPQDSWNNISALALLEFRVVRSGSREEQVFYRWFPRTGPTNGLLHVRLLLQDLSLPEQRLLVVWLDFQHLKNLVKY